MPGKLPRIRVNQRIPDQGLSGNGPAFVPAGASASRFSLVLGAWFIAETGLGLTVVAWLADRGVRWLRRPMVQRWLERITGIVLIGFGLRLATESRRFA
jgi:threonine/homoserine/homoserine lactone efflux protein